MNRVHSLGRIVSRASYNQTTFKQNTALATVQLRRGGGDDTNSEEYKTEYAKWSKPNPFMGAGVVVGVAYVLITLYGMKQDARIAEINRQREANK